MNPRLTDIVKGIAIGDALGSTGEFMGRQEVIRVYSEARASGINWPFAQYGSRIHGLKPGQWTDDTDMAICMVKAGIDPEKIAASFVDWMLSGPKDIGITIRKALEIKRLHPEGPYWFGGYQVYRMHPHFEANGSLMRNGVVAGMVDSLEDAYRLSLQHGMITHYHPMPQICCLAQDYVMWSLMHDSFSWDSWLHDFSSTLYEDIRDISYDPAVKKWMDVCGSDIDKSLRRFVESWQHPAAFDPFRQDLSNGGGHCLMSFRIAMWGLYYAIHDDTFKGPQEIPECVFDAEGSDRIGWIAMLGHDSDTYCAIAGAMMAAAGLRFSEELARYANKTIKGDTLLCIHLPAAHSRTGASADKFSDG
ncbi:MAG: ADP-ribosylglycohydrolase family protein [Methanothrix sp.]|jgi:ADP-ribosylglycohydrolase|uniref:ADP-ribosylglycohydrolase family protein n=1 Tax=Methanothrix sp. TaxID=90426 RepID=UPI00247D3625|nr:ADP-ribosylglycohydrolase family protein [Methanothrix sp.]